MSVLWLQPDVYMPGDTVLQSIVSVCMGEGAKHGALSIILECSGGIIKYGERCAVPVVL